MIVPTTIEEAAAACRAAFAAHPDAEWAWCCHHEERLEPLNEPAENRIVYILIAKPEHEQVARLNNFRPVLWTYPQVWRASKVVVSSLSGIRKAKARWDRSVLDYESISEPLHNQRHFALNELEAANIELLEACTSYRRYYLALVSSPECDAAHRTEVPHHTWNGKDIF